MEALKLLFQKGNDLLADSIATLESFNPVNDRGWMTELGVEQNDLNDEEFAAFVFIKRRTDILRFCSPAQKPKLETIQKALVDVLSEEEVQYVTETQVLDERIRAILKRVPALQIQVELNEFTKYIREQSSQMLIPETTDPFFPPETNLNSILSALHQLKLPDMDGYDLIERYSHASNYIIAHDMLQIALTQEQHDAEYPPWPGSVFAAIYGDVPDEEKTTILKEQSLEKACAHIEAKYTASDIVRELKKLDPQTDPGVRDILKEITTKCPETFDELVLYIENLKILKDFIDRMVRTDPFDQMVQVVLHYLDDAKQFNPPLFKRDAPILVKAAELSTLVKVCILNGKFYDFFKHVYTKVTGDKRLTPYYNEGAKRKLFSTLTKNTVSARDQGVNMKRIVYFLNAWPQLDFASAKLKIDEITRDTTLTPSQKTKATEEARDPIKSKLDTIHKLSQVDPGHFEDTNVPRLGGNKTLKRKHRRTRKKKEFNGRNTR